MLWILLPLPYKIRVIIYLYSHTSTLVIDDEFVHSPWTQGGSDSVRNGLAGIDIADNLRDSLGGICPFFQ